MVYQRYALYISALRRRIYNNLIFMFSLTLAYVKSNGQFPETPPNSFFVFSCFVFVFEFLCFYSAYEPRDASGQKELLSELLAFAASGSLGYFNAIQLFTNAK